MADLRVPSRGKGACGRRMAVLLGGAAVVVGALALWLLAAPEVQVDAYVLAARLPSRVRPYAESLLAALRQARSPRPSSRGSVVWFAPFLSGGGYCSEALSFVSALAAAYGDHLSLVHFGDAPRPDVVKSWKEDPTLSPLLERFIYPRAVARMAAPRVAVCHATGDYLHPSAFPGQQRCPPHGADIAIARTMFETDSIPRAWVEKLNRLDYVWVPSAFNARTFARAGVDAAKIRIVPEGVDTSVFVHKSHVQPLRLRGAHPNPRIRFLSVFKWEQRKGWDVLVRAFIAAFSGESDVELVIHTEPFHGDRSFFAQIQDECERHGVPWDGTAPRILIHEDLVPAHDMPRLYATAHALVAPSRGEGWGRPHAEAMSMGIPVIATNWSGNTAFMDASTSYLVDVDHLVRIDSGYNIQGHRWAEPSVTSLQRELQRAYADHQSGALEHKGARAAALMRAKYSPAAIADVVVAEIRRAIERAQEADEL